MPKVAQMKHLGKSKQRRAFLQLGKVQEYWGILASRDGIGIDSREAVLRCGRKS